MRRPAGRPFSDAFGQFDPSKHPRGPDGKFVHASARIVALSSRAGENVVERVEFAYVRRPAGVSKLTGIDVRGFVHAVSNQSISHMKRKHPNLTQADLAAIPEIVRSGAVFGGTRSGRNGEPRVEYRATVAGVRYGYVAEVRKGKRRLDAVTMYRMG